MVLNEFLALQRVVLHKNIFEKKTLAPCCRERGLKERTGSVRRGLTKSVKGCFAQSYRHVY